MRIRIDCKDDANVSRIQVRRTLRFRLGSYVSAVREARVTLTHGLAGRVTVKLVLESDGLPQPVTGTGTGTDLNAVVDEVAERATRTLSLRLEGRRRSG